MDFVGISDDIDSLDENEWDYIISKCGSLSTSQLVLIPGFRYRSDFYHGERIVLFDDISSLPTNLITKPSTLNSASEQISALVSNLLNYSYISIPIHSPYENISGNDIFRGRGFDFEKYRDILTYGVSSDTLSFVQDKEAAIEIYSQHGNADSNISFQNSNFLTTQTTAYTKYAIIIGKRFGFVSGSGGYSSRPGYYRGDVSSRVGLPTSSTVSTTGLTAVFSDTLSRASILDKIRNRSCYSTTGARIYLSVVGETIDENSQDVSGQMGTVIANLSYNADNTPKSPVKIALRAIADNSQIARIEIIRVMVDDYASGLDVLDSNSTTIDVFNKTNFGEDTGTLEFTDTDLNTKSVKNQEVCYYVKVTQVDGQAAWSSPIWFNYGRTVGIQASSAVSASQINGVTLLNTGSGTTHGDFGDIPATITGSSPLFTLPASQLNILINSDKTPYSKTRQIYSNKSLFVSDKISNITGIRLSASSDQNVLYGTHYIAFIPSIANWTTDYLISTTDLLKSYLNGQGQTDSAYKFLNDAQDPSGARTNKIYRSFLFGNMWQYSNLTDFKSTLSLEQDTVFSISGTNSPIVKDPYLYRNGDLWYLAYAGYSGNYPDRQDNILNVTFPVAGTDIDQENYNRVEEFAGLLEVTAADPLNFGYNQIISYANNSSNVGQRSFVNQFALPNIFNNGNDEIAYSCSPNIIQAASNDYRIYYLGWFNGKAPGTADNPNPILGLFCYQFTSFDTISSGTTTLSFAFTNTSSECPETYLSLGTRKSSNENFNFIELALRQMNSSDSTWPKINPAYCLPWLWCSVAKHDNGVYYAFFNVINQTTQSTFSTATDSISTGILFSTNGLDFFEYNPSDDSQKIDNIPGIYFVHPFKFSGEWYMSYRDSITGRVSWTRFNWTPKFSLSPTS